MWKTSILINAKYRKGITLVETVVSAFLIGLVAVSVLVIFAQTIDMSHRIDYEYNATNLAKSRLERAKAVMESRGFNSLSDLDETDSVVDADGVPDAEGAFKRSTTVSTNYLGNTRLTEVEVTIIYYYRGSWRTGAATTMATVFTNVD